MEEEDEDDDDDEGDEAHPSDRLSPVVREQESVSSGGANPLRRPEVILLKEEDDEGASGGREVLRPSSPPYPEVERAEGPEPLRGLRPRDPLGTLSLPPMASSGKSKEAEERASGKRPCPNEAGAGIS